MKERRETTISRGVPTLLALCLALILFTACGSQSGSQGGNQGSATAEDETARAGQTTAEETTAQEGTTEQAASGGQTQLQSQLPATVTGVDGNEVTVEDVSRIVPLNADITEIVYSLGFGENVVGVDVSATYPEEVQQLPKFGYQRELNAEGILSLEPTVIIGTEEAGPPEVIEQIRGTGTPVVILEDPPTLEAPGQKIRATAEALGVPEKGEELARRTEAEISDAQQLAASAESEPRVLFLYVRGQGTQLIGGKGTTADTLIKAAEGVNTGGEIGIQDYRPLTPESLATAQPDVILLLSGGLESVGGEEGLLEIPGMAQTPAGQNGRILAYEDLYLLGMGPRTGEALRDLTLGLHPELEE